MNTDQVPRHPVANDHTSRRSDQVAWKAPAASADTDPGGEPGPTIDEPAIDEPEWYPATRHPPHVKVMRPSAHPSDHGHLLALVRNPISGPAPAHTPGYRRQHALLPAFVGPARRGPWR